ncbi:MAG: DNA-processing protein DprA [Acidobacteriia bacterium]|nr:DNA-processing protein DprA [Terriglobia bacterium]
MAELRSWVALSLLSGLGLRSVHALLAKLESPDRILSLTLSELMDAGVMKEIAARLSSQKLLEEADAEISKAHQLQVALVPLDCASYPPLLKEIFDPPILLYLLGQAEVLGTDSISVVGARRATTYGLQMAVQLARDLASRGLTVTSGLARGIDSAAHRGALEGKGKSIAVLGSGIDVIYPKENRKLAGEILKDGAILSEFPIGSFPAPQNFPIRNRIISGLSLGTLIVEAAEYSGSLITARLACEQNREVFAVPGNITQKTAFGPNLWIKQGAKLVQTWQDVVEECPARVKERLLAVQPDGPQGASLFDATMTGEEKRVYDVLRVDEPLHIDVMMSRTRLSQSELLGALLELELKDHIRQLPGKCFVRRA